MVEPAPTPAWARRFVVAFLAVFVVCGVGAIDAWPFSGWRLFSQVRTEHVTRWAAQGVDGDGRTSPIPFRSLPGRTRPSGC